MARIAENTVIVDGQEYKPGDVIPDFKSIRCVDTREPRKYQGLSADVSVLNDVIAKYASGGASCFMSDTGEYYEYDREEKTWKLITNITERGFGSEKAYGALKHMLKNVTVSDEKIQSAVTNYLTVNPVLPGATTEQAWQIEQNKTDVAALKEETGSLKEDLFNGGLTPIVYTYDTFKADGEKLLIYREDGTTASTESNLTIQFIPVAPKCFINYTLTQMVNVASIALYDQNKVFVKAIYSETDSDWDNPTPLSGTYVVEDGIYYMSLCVQNNMLTHYTENLKLELSGAISKVLPDKIEALEKDWIYKFEKLFESKWAAVDLGNLDVGDKIYLNIFDKSENVEIEYITVQGYKKLNDSPVAVNTLTFRTGKFIELDANYEKVEIIVTSKEFVKQSWVHGYFVKIDSTTPLSEIYKNISAVNDQLSDITDNTKILKNLKPQVEDEIVRLTYEDVAKSDKVGYLTTDGVFVSTLQYRLSPIIPVAEGDELVYQCSAWSNDIPIIIFYDRNHNYIKHISGNERTWENPYPVAGKENVPKGCYYIRWCMEHVDSDHYHDQYVTITRKRVNNIGRNAEIALNDAGYRILILGDSYSDMGCWVRGMEEMLKIDSLINLGVAGATIRDRWADRVQYPYTARPLSTYSDNKNTVASQIEKLKRLMVGTDLDEGESQIYRTKNEYPNIIIIEGGMNDNPDSEDTVATYFNQFLIKKENVYYKDATTTSQTTAYVKPDLDAINRTCFAGAYRYIVEQLLGLFPDAQLFITTASHMNYFTKDPNYIYGKIAEQQRKCADILSCTVIDWHAEGNLNTIQIGLKGSGTADDPYTFVGGNTYTTDLLHPNDIGGRRYGRLAAKIIQQRFLGLS